jgi:MoaA/NifB/PqqE/SkfB family radical SAM enzyme
MLRIADALATIRPRVVHLSGGEPLIVPGFIAVAERLRDHGISVVLTTSGFGLDDALAAAVARTCHSVHVSVDGADAETHDRIRGRAGSFAAALTALGRLDALGTRYGIDFVVLRSNFDQIERLLTKVVPRFPRLEFVILNGVVPQGLASRESYEPELLTDEQTRLLGEEGFQERLQALAPPGVVVSPRDNLDLKMHPELVEEGVAWTLDRLIVEPDGLIRALEVYEGHVGNLLEEPAQALWDRVCERRRHPLVQEATAQARSSGEWAAAARRIDRSFASPADLVRLARRKAYDP